MKIYYVVNARIPTEKAHGIQIMKMCEAFAKLGMDVELVLPSRGNPMTHDPFEYYGIEQRFRIKKLPALDLFGLWQKSFLFSLDLVIFGIISSLYLFFRSKGHVVYTRGEMILFLSKLVGSRAKLFVETHIKPTNMTAYVRAFKKCAGIVVVTKAYRAELIGQYRLPENKVILAADGADIKKIQITKSKVQVRNELALPIDKKIVVYTGSDLKWKGLNTLKQAVKILPQNTIVCFVGHIDPLNPADARAIFVGHKDPEQIPLWLAAADVLVLTGTAKSRVSTNYTSPLKLFEYMAANRPIVASDLPSFRDILSRKNSVLVAPDDPMTLAQGIAQVLADQSLAEKISRQAAEEAQKYSWDNRARMIAERF